MPAVTAGLAPCVFAGVLGVGSMGRASLELVKAIGRGIGGGGDSEEYDEDDVEVDGEEEGADGLNLSTIPIEEGGGFEERAGTVCARYNYVIGVNTTNLPETFTGGIVGKALRIKKVLTSGTTKMSTHTTTM